MGEYDTNRFMNTAYVVNPIHGRTMPYSTPGAEISFLPDLDPMLSFLIVDPMGRPDTSGLSRLFACGVSLYGQLRVAVHPWGLRDHQMLEVSYLNG